MTSTVVPYIEQQKLIALLLESFNSQYNVSVDPSTINFALIPSRQDYKLGVELTSTNTVFNSIQTQLTTLHWELPATSGVLDGNNSVSCPATAVSTTVLNAPEGSLFDVTFRIRGVVELNSYVGGTNDGSYFGTGGTVYNEGSNPVNVYEIQISDPPQTYYINFDQNGYQNPPPVVALDYNKTLQVAGGATITLSASSGGDSKEISNFNNLTVSNSDSAHPIFVTQPYAGQFAQLDAITVVGGNTVTTGDYLSIRSYMNFGFDQQIEISPFKIEQIENTTQTTLPVQDRYVCLATFPRVDFPILSQALYNIPVVTPPTPPAGPTYKFNTAGGCGYIFDSFIIPWNQPELTINYVLDNTTVDQHSNAEFTGYTGSIMTTSSGISFSTSEIPPNSMAVIDINIPVVNDSLISYFASNLFIVGTESDANYSNSFPIDYSQVVMDGITLFGIKLVLTTDANSNVSLQTLPGDTEVFAYLQQANSTNYITYISSTTSATNDNTPTIVGTGKAGNTITLTLNGTTTYTTTVLSNNTWSIPITTALPDGNYTVMVKATNSSGVITNGTGIGFTVKTHITTQLVIDPITPDNNISSAEASQQITITGSLADVGAGESPGGPLANLYPPYVEILIGTTTAGQANFTIDQTTGGYTNNWSITVAGSLLAANTSVTGNYYNHYTFSFANGFSFTYDVIDSAGNTGQVTATKTYTVSG